MENFSPECVLMVLADQRADRPLSLYAATKRADELLSESYAHLFGIPQTGLRFFTVYGPWGWSDIALWLFTEAVLEGRLIRLFNRGRMRRDFTYIHDIVNGLLSGSSTARRRATAARSRAVAIPRMPSTISGTTARKKSEHRSA